MVMVERPSVRDPILTALFVLGAFAVPIVAPLRLSSLHLILAVVILVAGASLTLLVAFDRKTVNSVDRS
jgi:hypothetical protein